MSKKPIQKPETPMFVSWGENDERGRALAMRQASEALRAVEPIVRTHGSSLWFNVGNPNVSVRDGFNRNDYESFRHGEALPVKPKEIIHCCMEAYDNVGIIRNIIDLMADFATQGIDLNHPNERIEKWYKEWFRRVGGKERSERFLNLFYRTGNVIVQRQTAKLPVRVEKQMKRAKADPDLDVPPDTPTARREIPWRYVFRNPLLTEVLADELALFVGQDSFTYAIKIPKTLAAKVKAPQTATERALVAKLPAAVRQAIQAGEYFIPLDEDKVKGFYYKRDDWQVWAKPMVSSILSDLQMLQKMKLADLAALDGAISCIRVWKLGDIQARIMPTQVAINRLAEMLCNNVGGGVMDLVWGPEIDLLETSTEVHRFLGETKYAPVLTAIYAGLGIPPTLTGAAGGMGGTGFTNNFISLKTLTERLAYGRDILAQFWMEEIRLVQKAMGFRFPATLTFDRMVLTDEAAEKQLLINLADRDLISIETLQERFGEDPAIEQVRIRREARKRQSKQMPAKASPFHDPQQDYGLEKIFAQTGMVAPSQVGLDLDEPKKGEKSLLDRQEEQTTKQTKLQMQGQQQQNDHQYRMENLQLKHGVHPLQQQQQGPVKKGQPGQGRPKNAKDSGPRKQKRVTPRTSASFFQTFAWAENAQTRIGQIAGAAYLKALSKKTLRELTDDEARNFERFKFYLLCQLEPNQAVDEQTVAILSKKELAIPAQVAELLRTTVAKHVEMSGKEPTLEVLRRYQAGAFAFWKGDFEEEVEE